MKKSYLIFLIVLLTVTSGLANDELGYILPREDYRYPLNPFNPKDHYEETMSISKEIGPKLMEAVDDLLKNEPGVR